jgi:hypothetical protein
MPERCNRLAIGYQALELTPRTRTTTRSTVIKIASDPKLGAYSRGGLATLSVNGQKVAEGRIANTNANLFSADEGTDVGMDEDTPVAEACQAGVGSRFTGKINKVTVEVK